MRTMFLVMTLILTLGLGVALAQSADEAAINEVIERYFAALNEGDAEGYAACYAENGVRAIGTNITVGRANIEKASSEGFAADGGLEITFTRHATRLLSPTTAIVHGATEVPSATPPEGHSIYTLVKEGNEWLIAALQTGAAPPVQ